MQIPTQNDTGGKREQSINDGQSFSQFKSEVIFYHNFKTEKQSAKDFFILFKI